MGSHFPFFLLLTWSATGISSDIFHTFLISDGVNTSYTMSVSPTLR